MSDDSKADILSSHPWTKHVKRQVADLAERYSSEGPYGIQDAVDDPDTVPTQYP